jgi:16S rRNA (cytidine1402-2'-O)-methyltransferase
MTIEQQTTKTGTLYVVATPIGNLEDITLRAIRILGEVDIIAAEDTRHTRKLLSHLGIAKPLLSYFKDKEAGRGAQIIERLTKGENVALVSDAGTPAISDPGHIVTRLALAAGIRVVPIPGPSALTAALSVAGLAADTFLFIGFLPSRTTTRRKLLRSMVHHPFAIVFYESPHRLEASLRDCLDIFGDRRIFWGRELTKMHEEVQSSILSRLTAKLATRRIKGESVLIIQGEDKEEEVPEAELGELLSWYKRNSGLSLKDAVRKVSNDLGLPRSAVYKKGLEIWQS